MTNRPVDVWVVAQDQMCLKRYVHIHNPLLKSKPTALRGTNLRNYMPPTHNPRLAHDYRFNQTRHGGASRGTNLERTTDVPTPRNGSDTILVIPRSSRTVERQTRRCLQPPRAYPKIDIKDVME